ncbi:MAG: cobalamin biosynthesis protein CobW [Ruminococcaceae bacterium]|nr:cobalamin biosynthesis protein CobW [Oscillospiraceae bacterium]
MTKIDIFSGFLGAGKTTLIKKLLREAYTGEKIVLIENEFGQIGIDGGFLQDAGIIVNEMNSGCICCSLVGDFGKALQKVLAEYAPDRILIEPSGVGKLSDIIRAVQNAAADGAVLNGFTTVVDAGKCKMYMKNFGEFFNDQVENAGCIILSHTQMTDEKKVAEAIELLKAHNSTAVIVATPWDELDGKQLLEAMERRDTIEEELARLAEQTEHEHHHHHHHDDDDECDDPNCSCHHHHDDDDEDEHEHHHHHHHDDDDDECDDPNCSCHHHHDDDDEDEHEHHHHHHHDDDDDDECDDPECSCHHHHDDDDEDEHEHHHHHHHHHHADDVFVSWGVETNKAFDEEELKTILETLVEEHKYGVILRAKGIVAGKNGKWIHFDYVPGEPDVRHGSAGVIGRLCVIGSGIQKAALAELFGVEKK